MLEPSNQGSRTSKTAGPLASQVPPTVLVRVSHPIFHNAVNSTPSPLRSATNVTSPAGKRGDGDGGDEPEGKLGSLQVRHRHIRQSSLTSG